MGFDWKSFATGFMETTLATLEERQAEAKQFEEDQRRAAERNAAVISRRRAIADQVTGYANYLQANGVSDEQLQAVIASGPEAIRTLTERVQEAVEANNGRPLGSSDTAALISMPEGFTALDMTTQEFIDSTYGLSVPSQEPEDQQQFGMLDRLFGRDQMARARGRLADTPFMDGMSIQQINQAALQGDYTSLVPGTFTAIASTTSGGYSAVEEGAEFADMFERRMARLRQEDAYTLALGEDGGEIGENTRALIQERLGGLITAYADRYGEAFIADQGSFLESFMGEGYMETLIDQYVLSPRDQEEPRVTGTEVREPDAPEVQGATTDGQPEVMTSPGTMSQPADLSGTPEAFTGEQAQPQLDAESPDPSKPMEVVSRYEAWQRMSREERRDAGLPLGELEAQIYFNRILEGMNAPSLNELVGPAGTGDPEQNEDYQRMVEMGMNDETIALLNSHGGDIQAYLEEKGAKTSEEIFMALNDFGVERGVVMPFDKAGLISVFMPILNRNQ